MKPNQSNRLPHRPSEYFVTSPVRLNVTRLLALFAILLLSLLVCVPSPGYSHQAMGRPSTGQDIESKEKPAIAHVPWNTGYVSASERHKIKLAKGELANDIAARGGRLVGDYGDSVVMEVGTAAAKELINNQAIELRDEDNLIRLNAGAIDTTTARGAELQSVDSRAAKGEKLMHLVQFAGPIKPEWYEALVATGAEIVSYIPSNAYLVYGDNASIRRIKALARTPSSFVQWEGTYANVYRIDPRILLDQQTKEKLRAEGLKTKSLKGSPGSSDLGLFAVQLFKDPAANSATLQLINQIKTQKIKVQWEILSYVNLVVGLNNEDVRTVAARPDVVSVAQYLVPQKLDERQNMIISGNLTVDQPVTGLSWLTYLAAKGFTQDQFTGSNFLVNISDSGIDNANPANPNHFAFHLSGDLTQASRLIYARLEGTPNAGSTLQGCDGHGTENGSIIMGYVANGMVGGVNFNAFPHTDASGFHYGLGVCPFVKLGSSVIFDPTNFTFPHYANLESEAYNAGARVSSNSWGAPTGGAYDVDSQTYDALVRDAQPAGSTFPTAGNQEYTIVFAAGNKGAGANTVGSPGTAKNIITAGASESVQAFGGSDGCAVPDTGADHAFDVINFSSRGPTDDGRKKPDLMAPGTHISGVVAQASAVATGTGAANGCFTGTGVCGGVSSIFFPSAGQQFYTASSGTSHSAPAIAGACALVRQFWLNTFSAPPSPAMTKAALMSSTTYMTGFAANDTLWSNVQGMGLMNVDRLFTTISGPVILRDEVASDLFTASGRLRVFNGTIADNTKPFRVTLAWTDAPGPTSGNAFVNNLDLEVTIGGNTYKGNVFSGGNSATGGTADAADNVESVFLPAGVSGPIVVTVKATNIAGDGVPGNASPLDQDFALVVTNVVPAEPAPVIASAGAPLVSESCAPTNGVPDPNETIAVSFCAQNAGSANTTNLVGTLQNTGGVTCASGPANYGVMPVGGSPVCRNFTFTASGTCGGTITATIHFQDGATDLGNVTYNFTLGVPNAPLTENFDGVIAPALPAGWTTAATGAESAWVTSTTTPKSAPNDAFAPDPGAVGNTELFTPTIALPAGGASQLSFKNNYNTDPNYDGMVLEISINGGAFADILTAGGSFVAGGYNATISPSWGSPIAGRMAWSGNSGGYITTTVNLPAGASGQNIRLKWRMASDSFISSVGVRIDDITISASTFTCCQTAGAPCLPSFTIDDVTHNEGDSGTTSYTFTVTKMGGATLDAGVNFTTVDGSATTADNDYQAQSATLTFLPTETTKTITILINGDTKFEPDETFMVHLSGATNATISDADGAGAIINDDSVPTFAIDDVTHNEGNAGTTSYTFTVAKIGGTALTSLVNFTNVDGTATTANNDYQANSGTLTFLPMETTKTIIILANGDTTFEADETFTVHLSGASGATISDADGAGTITNDDSAPTFAVDDVAHVEGNAGTTSYTFTVTRTGSTALNSSVNFTTVDGTATTADNDYQAQSGTLNFLPTDTTKTITVLVNGDTTFEPDETFTVHLSGATGATIADADGTGTITNDDSVPTLAIDDVTHNEGDAGTTLYTFTVTKTGSTALNSSVNFTTVDGTATTANIDYQSNSGTLTFLPTDTAKTITVLVNGDTTLEPDEAFTVHLSGASSATISDADGTGTITNDDSVPSFAIDDVTHVEGNAGTTSYTFTVTKTGGTALNSAVNFATVNGTATTANNDYQSLSGTLTFLPTDTTKQITVLVNGDTTFEPDEAFTVHLSGASGATISDADGTGTITNDDVAPPTLGNYPDTNLQAGANTMVTPEAAPTSAVSMNVSTTSDFRGTFAASPTTGVVYVTNAQPAGTYTVTVTAFNSVGVTTTKTFTLTVSNPTQCNLMSFSGVSGSPFGAGTSPGSVAVGDFNGDGKQDLATANAGSANVTVLLGNGSGGFSEASSSPFAVGSGPFSVAVGDFNGDGKQDLATANRASSNVTVLLGNGSGGFSAGPGSPFAAGTNPRSVAMGDFNGDGKQDLTIANDGSSNVTVLLGDGSGSFSPASGSPFTVGSGPGSVAVGDFNGDGKLDLATTNFNSNNVTVLLGNGSGGFSAATGSPFTVGSAPVSVAVGDFNGDGKQDLTTSNFDHVTVLLGDGSGGFSEASGSPFAVAGNNASVTVGDFNGDGKLDLTTANANSNNVAVLLGNGSGSFSPASGSPFAVGGTVPVYVAVGDFNSDGKLDLATANLGSDNATVLLNTCTLNTAPSITAIGVTRQQGSPSANAIIANVNDLEDLETALTVTVNGGTTATVNGVTVSAISVDVAGVVTADVIASCTATTATFTLRATDTAGLFSEATLTVTVNPNTAPTLTYSSPQAVVFGGLLNLPPTATGDNGAVSYSVQSGHGLTTPPTVDASGVVSIIDAQPSGTHTITVRATDNCGAITDATFTLNVGAMPTFAIDDVTHSEGNAGTTAYTFTVTKTGSTALSSSVNFTTVDGTATTANIDYQAQSGSLTFLPADTTKTITVLVNGDTIVEPDEAFTIHLSNPSGSTISDADGIGTITNDDVPPPTLGNYPSTTVQAGANTSVTPGAAPTGATSMNVSTVSAFKGAFAASPTTGVVQVTNAHPAGTYTVTVMAFNSLGVTTTKTFTLTVTNPTQCNLLSFSGASGSPFGAGNHPVSVAVGDFNGDGKQDLTTADDNPNMNLMVLLGDGSGGFSPAPGSPLHVFAYPLSVAVGDFNGDGKLDLTTANINSNDVKVLLGNGSGGFTAASGSPFAVGSDPYSVAVGDFNGDGKLDLATANHGSSDVTVLLGDGSGSFSPASGSPFAAGSSPYSLAVGDFNGDGKLDLTTANSGSSNVTVLLGDGLGGFSPASTSPFAAGSGPQSVGVGDFNGDGKLDLTTANDGSHNVTVLLGDGSGGFSPASGSPFAVGFTPDSVAVGDFNGDGKQDLTTANFISNDVTVLLGNGLGGFSPATGSPFAVGSGPWSVAVGDFNSDGKQDLTTANFNSNDVTVLLSTCTPNTAPTISALPVTRQQGSPSANATIANVNDVGQAANTLSVTVNGGTNATVNGVVVSAINVSPAGVVIADVVADCTATTASFTLRVTDSFGLFNEATLTVTVNPNIAPVLTYASPQSVVFGGSLNLSPTTTGDNGAVTYSVQSGHGLTIAPTVDASGVVSIINAQPSGAHTITIRATDNCGAFTDAAFTLEVVMPTLGNYPDTTVQAGANTTVTPDAAPTSTASINVSTASAFNSAFAASPTTGVVMVTNAQPAGTYAVTVKAFNSAGRSTTKTFTLTVTNPVYCDFLSFSGASGSPFAAGSHPGSVAVGDFNGDGRLDLTAANEFSSNVTVLLGNGSGGFSEASGSPFAVGAGPASVAVGDFNGDGKLDLTTVNHDSNNVTVLLGNGSGGFSEASGSPFAVGAYPHSVAVGDFNGDGKLDLTTANSNSNSLTVLFGDGSGSFSQAIGSPFAVGSYPYSVAVGDFNGDGKLDLTAANFYLSNSVTVLLGDGGGGFSETSGSPFAVGSGPSSVAVGDLNGDGKLDITTANAWSYNVTVLLGNGSGGFSPATGSPFAIGTNPWSVAVGDFNGDGKPDLTTANRYSDNVTVLLGDGLGGFSAAIPSPFAAGSTPWSVAVGDFNSDGKLDLTTANIGSSNLTVLLNTCTPNTAPTISAVPVTRQQGSPSANATIANVNDVGQAASTLSVTVNGGTSTTVNGVTVSAISVSPAGVVTADVVADCTATTASFTLRVTDSFGLFNEATLTVTVSPNTAPVLTYASPQSVVVGGSLNLSPTATGDNGAVTYSVRSGHGLMTPPTVDASGVVSITNAQPAGAHTVTIRTTDNCGAFTDAAFTLNAVAPPTLGNYPDTTVRAGANTTVTPDAAPTNTTSMNVSTASAFNGTFATSPTTGVVQVTNAYPAGTYTVTVTAFNSVGVTTKTFTLTVTNPVPCDLLSFSGASGSPFTVGSLPYSVVVGDFNGDGKQDLATANEFSNNVTVLLGDGGGGFSGASGSPFSVGTTPYSVAVGDFNGDGKLDLTAANVDSHNLTVLLGNGSGGFSEASGSPFAIGSGPRSVAVGDFNGDGKLDLTTATFSGVTVLLGDGSGGFSPAPGSPFGVGSNPWSVSVGDFNGDGKLDLTTPNQGSNNVTVLLGDGSGGFSQASGSPFAVGSSPLSVAVGDFNADGKLDLTIANEASNNVTVLLGNGSGGFSPAPGSPFAVGSHPYSVAVGDFNGDGKLDLTTANPGSSNVTVLLGNGSGVFSEASSSPFGVGGYRPPSVAVGDFNGDGRLDLTTATNSSKVTVLLNTCTLNTAPAISAVGVTRQQGSPSANATIANVNDLEDLETALTLTVNGGASATVNGVTVSGISVSTAGVVTADVIADCTATSASFTLRVTDTSGLFNEATLSVTVNPNTAPTLTYSSPQAVVFGGSLNVSPTATGDNGAVTYSVQTGHGLTTAPTVDSSGVVSITNAQPSGAHTITIRATDNCGAVTDAAFTLDVGAVPAFAIDDVAQVETNSGTTSFVFTVTKTGSTTLNSSVNFTTVDGTARIANNDYQANSGTLTFLPTDATKTITVLVNGDTTFEPDEAFSVHLSGASGATISDADGTGTITNDDVAPPTLGNYRDTTVQTGANTTVTPDTAPTSTTNMNVSTASAFRGMFVASPTTGVVQATNAQPAGTYTVTVTAFNSVGVTTTKTFTLTVTNATQCDLLSFSGGSGSPFAVGVNPQSVAVGDFNDDGKQDLVAANYNSHNVTVLMGDGIGGFSPASGSPFAAGLRPYSVAVGDFNGDGKLDLAIANRYSDNLTVLLGNGSGGFSPVSGSPFPVGGSEPSSMAVGDFNGDGKQDLATANRNSSNVTVLLGNGSGGFSPASGSPFAVGSTPYSVALGDFNGDGKPDLTTANGGSSNVTVLLGNGSGGFSPATGSPFAVGSTPYSVALGDFNGDGKLDITIANRYSDNVTVLLGNGSGGFSPASGSPFPVGGSEPFSMAVGDFNGDGTLDLTIANYISYNVTVLLGNGSGGFSPATGSPFAVGLLPNSVTVGDFNGDGKQDAATTNFGSDSVTVLLNTCSLNTTPTISTVAVTRQQGSPSANATIANVNDLEDPETALTLTVNGGTSATANGVTVSSISISAAGVVTADVVASCTATTATFTLRVTDTGGHFNEATLTVTVNPNTAPTLTYASPQSVVVGGFLNLSPIATEDNGAVTYSIQAGHGLTTAPTVDSSGVVSITNAQPSGAHTITIRATDNCGAFTDATFTLNIGAVPTFAIDDVTHDEGNVGTTSYTFTVTKIGSTALSSSVNFTTANGTATTANNDYQLNSGVLNFLAMDTTKQIIVLVNCDTTVEPDETFFVNLSSPTNASLADSQGVGTITNDDVDPPSLGNYPDTTVPLGANTTITPDAAPTNTTSINVSTVSAFTGALAANTTTGVVQVTNAQPTGTYLVTVTAFNSAGVPTTKMFTLTVHDCPSPINISPASLPAGTLGAAYSQTITASGGASPYIFALAAGGLPPGLILSGGGALTGTPATAGSFTFTLKATAFNGCVVNRVYTMSVVALNPCGATSFSGPTSFGTGAEPLSVASGDFNGDNHPDLVTANVNSNSLSILLGDGAGGFSGPTSITVLSGPYAVAVGDFNADNKLDIVVAKIQPGTVALLLGNGAGGFGAPTDIAVVPSPRFLAVADFSGDGRLDLAVANGGSPNVTILLGNGAGGFNPPTDYFVGDAQNAIALGDFNADGRIDLACAGTSANVFILAGNGIGGFGAATSFAVSSQPLAVAAADLNLDSKLDLVTADYNTNKLSILLGNGAGGFVAATSIDAGVRPRSMTVGDFNNDGRADVAVANEGSNNVAVHLGNGVGGFSAGSGFDLGAIPLYVIAGRFNADSRLDLVATMHTSGAAVLLNTCCGCAISPASAFFSVSGSEGAFNLTTFPGCNWNASSNDSWIELTSEPSGSGPAEISYIVRDNFSPVPRVGTITVAGLTFTITQDSETAPDCTYNISPLFESHAATGGSGSISVATDERCAWQAVSDASWITITSGCCAIGNGSVTYSVAANPGPSGRAGTITIGGKAFNVKQKGN